VRAYFDLFEERGPLLDMLSSRFTGPAGRAANGRRQPFIRELAGVVQNEYDVSPRRARALAGLLISVCATSSWMWRSYRMSRPEIENMCVAFMLAGVEAGAGE
jgi:hypothetical protein